MGRNGCQVQVLQSIVKDYSTVIKTNKPNSTVTYIEVRSNLTDLIPDDGYDPFYSKMFNEIGYNKFMELANKARAGSNTPQRLFCWMLKNSELVR